MVEMRKVSDDERKQIVADVASEFHCFGKGVEPDPSNPISEWTKDESPTFALGVDVREVVDYVISRL